MLVGLALIPIHAAAMLWMPRLLGETLDLLTAGGDDVALAATCWLMLGLAGAEAAARFTSRKLLIDTSRMVERSMKDELVGHLHTLPTAWFDRARTGDLTSRMTQDIELMRFVIGPMLLHGGSALCLLPAGLVLMLSMNVSVALASLAALLFVYPAAQLMLASWDTLAPDGCCAT